MNRFTTRAIALLAMLMATCALWIPSTTAGAQTSTDSLSNPTEAAAAWLADQFVDGLLPGFTPGSTDIGLTLQAIIGFAATGTENTAARTAWTAVTSDLEGAIQVGGVDAPGRLGLLIAAAVALGEDPTSVGGVDLVARLLATQQPSGLFGAADPTYDGAFRQGLALLGLSAAGVTNVAGTDWLTDQQCADGSYVAYRADTSVPCPAVDAASFTGPDTNSTALALLGLSTQGELVPAAASGAFLADMHDASGAVPYWADVTQPTDANSTALVVAAMRALLTTPYAQEQGLNTFQLGCDSADVGAFAFQPDTDGSLWADTFATAQALWGLGATLPVVDATMAESVAAVCATVTTTTTTAPTTTTAATTTTTGATTTTAAIQSTTTAPTTTAPTTTAQPTTSQPTTTQPPTTQPTTSTQPKVAAATQSSGSTSGTRMARTGATSTPLVLVGAMLIGLGIGFVALARRRS